MKKLVVPLLLAACVALAPRPLFAEELKIVDVVAPVLMLWGDTNGATLLKEIPKSQVPKDLPVHAISPNMMLQVNVNGTDGWVFSHHVRTNKKPEISAECLKVAGATSTASKDVGAVRGLGEGCKPK